MSMPSETSVLIKNAAHLADEVRKQAIGDPVWISDKCVYEYLERSPRVVAVLKLIRMAHGLVAFDLLRVNGLFIDMGAIVRCVYDCESEIYFLLENYPSASPNVEKFVKAFFEQTIDEFLNAETEAIPVKKIRAAMVRVLHGQHDSQTVDLLQRAHRTFSGYVHAGYAHIMETYGGGPLPSFNMMGVPSPIERDKRREIVTLAAHSVMYCALFIAHSLSLTELSREIAAACFQDQPVR
jgi:hypothetical protein